MDRYNLDKLIKVRSFDSQYEPRIIFKEGRKKSFWKSEVKRGYHYKGTFEERYLGEALSNEYHELDGDVYEKPKVILLFQDKITKTIYFDSLREADQYVEELTSTKNWI